MNDLNPDAEVPLAALAALQAAQRKAIESGHPVVFVRAGQLVRIVGDGKESVIKQMPQRTTVKNRLKRMK